MQLEPLCTVSELRGICLWPSGTQEFPTEDCDEVYPGIFLGNAASASDIEKLNLMNIGYVLNAAHGLDASLNMIQVLSPEEYQLSGIVFLGIPAIDMMSYPLNSHFGTAVSFIKEGLVAGKGVLVHCKQGISRSAALVLAYLVQEEGLELQEATRVVRSRREILPNDGFLMQLCELNEFLNNKKGLSSGKGVLVHCKQGISRSAGLVLAYLVQEEELELQKATRVVMSRREMMGS
ncbi:hypothetical protein JTE90_013034 [Oedothorax gibbosus]|uniref:protein-serine/threonine phosphatase n=1 Tax=Oedothorax gibbosus TaxID=931172 RepID=A0AAV6UI41_9ARAC|nr:hypothetical protein JTE90_013034 [Oedothorax gibbosus]